MPQTHIAFIGLGLMGAPMAQNLSDRSEFTVTAWNRTQSGTPLVDKAKAHGVNIAPTIAAAVATADIICICVSDVSAVETVIFGGDGIAQSARSGSIVIDFSTIGPQSVRDIAHKLQPYNLYFLDAPVSGGDIGAQQGTLTIMVGGEKTAFDRALPVFEVLGKKIVHCGAVGSGQAIKLCNQILCGVHMVALCEAMVLAKQLGVDPELAIEVCSSGAGGSWALANLAAKAVNGDFQPGFTIEHILKDLRLVNENLHGESLPGVDLAEQMFQLVRDLGGAKQGTQAMIRAYTEHK
jgi:3-hydroxyisobutyrate dehydrogenase